MWRAQGGYTADDQEPIEKGRPASVATGERAPEGEPRGAGGPKIDEAIAPVADVPAGAKTPAGAAPQRDNAGKE